MLSHVYLSYLDVLLRNLRTTTRAHDSDQSHDCSYAARYCPVHRSGPITAQLTEDVATLNRVSTLTWKLTHATGRDVNRIRW